jgi:hypothetical protein
MLVNPEMMRLKRIFEGTLMAPERIPFRFLDQTNRPMISSSTCYRGGWIRTSDLLLPK